MCQPLDKPHISFLLTCCQFHKLVIWWLHSSTGSAPTCPQNLFNLLTLVCQHVSIVVSYDVSRMKPWKIHNIASGRKRIYWATNQWWQLPTFHNSSCFLVRISALREFLFFHFFTRQIDLKHKNQLNNSDNMVKIGIDLREYYPSVEWDILGVPAERHEKYYPCCAEPYPGK